MRLDQSCYHTGQPGTLLGKGFPASSSWRALLDGRHPFGSGTVDGLGGIHALFDAPALHRHHAEQRRTITVVDGGVRATRAFLLTPLDASIFPASGDPATMRVRFRVLGMGARRTVYLHEIAPSGRLRSSRRLGATQGACGHLHTPRALRLFPSRPGRGTWKLQLDAARRWSPSTAPRVVIPFAVP